MKPASRFVVDPVAVPWVEMDIGELFELRALVGTWYVCVMEARAARDNTCSTPTRRIECQLAVQTTGLEILKWVSERVADPKLKWKKEKIA